MPLFYRYIYMVPTAVDILAESTTVLVKSSTELTNLIVDSIYKNVPIIGNAAILSDSMCTTCRAGLNLYCSPSPIASAFFCASCVCGLISATSSGLALLTPYGGIPIAGWVGSFSARGFNRAGKYALHLGNVTSGSICMDQMIAFPTK